MAAAFNKQYGFGAMRLLAVYNEGCDLERELTAKAALLDRTAAALEQYVKNHRSGWESISDDSEREPPRLLEAEKLLAEAALHRGAQKGGREA